MDLKYEIELLKDQQPKVLCNVGTIDYDLTTFSNKVNELVKQIKTEKVTRDTIKDYKELKATLNKFSKEINDEKIKIVKEFTTPIDVFTEEVKTNLALIKEGIASIDKQLKDFDKQEKQLLKEDYEKMWDELGLAEHIPFIRIEKQDWYKASASKAKVKNDMMNMVDDFKKDINLIKINVDNEEEATSIINKYYGSLDVNEELGKYREYKNLIKNEPKVIEKVVEKIVEKPIEVDKVITTPKKEEKPTQPILEPKNEEIDVASLFDVAEDITKTKAQEQELDVVFSFKAKSSFIEHIEKLISEETKGNYFRG